MILPNLAKASMGLVEKQKNLNKDTTVGSVAPHSHDSSKDSAQQIPPIAPPQPDNITGNLTNNQIIQDKGKALWQGEQMANQFATRQMDEPVPPPGDAVGDGYGDMFNQPFSKKGDPKKGKPYVVNKEKTGTSRDTLYLPKDTYVSKDGYAEDSDIDDAARKAAAKGIYNYTGGQRNFNFEYLEGSGKVKYKK